MQHICHEDILFYDKSHHKLSKEKNFVHINFFFACLIIIISLSIFIVNLYFIIYDYIENQYPPTEIFFDFWLKYIEYIKKILGILY